MYYADDMIKKLKEASQLVVFGAGNVTHLIVKCLQNEPYCLPIEFCLVSDTDQNPGHVDGIPVIGYRDAELLVRKDAVILLAVAEKYLETIMEGLFQHNFSNIILVTYESDLWSLFRGNIYRRDRLLHHKKYLTIEEELERSASCAVTRTISVYSARCHVDKALKEDVSRFSWEIPIQVGAALTTKRICDICDNTGDHISEKNRQYCELTALYWIWKNDMSDYVGLGHYRRHFELGWEEIKRLARSDIDVVLTIPIMDIPNVETVYRRDHISADWDNMLDAVHSLSPDYMDAVREMQKGRFYYAYNMFIMRREVLEDYCTWLFPILSYCEEHCKEKEDTYQNRYIGFLAEHLMSAYFLYHEEDYKIVHAKKHFIMC